jgi:Flp pilus assembly pilin Flp
MGREALRQFVCDDTGQDLVEYALLSGIIGIAGMLLFPTIVEQMAAAYTNWHSGAQDVWRPCAPAPAACP